MGNKQKNVICDGREWKQKKRVDEIDRLKIVLSTTPQFKWKKSS